MASHFKFFLFVNPSSGNNEGSQYLTLKGKTIFKFSSGIVAEVKIYNLCDKQSRDLGLSQAYAFQQDRNIEIRIIICGGDGSITWLLSQAITHNIDMKKVVFGILPIGTGNDFSRTLGWGYKPPHFNAQSRTKLAKIVHQWTTSVIRNFDVWDVELTTYEGGKIFDVKSQEEVQRASNTMKKFFTNYVGIGLDARVVYTVQRCRTKSALLNKIVYAFVGCCNFFRPMKKLEQLVEGFAEQGEEESQDEQISEIKHKYQMSSVQKNLLISEEQTLSPPSDLQEKFSKHLKESLEEQRPPAITIENDKTKQQYHMKNGYRGLVCMNITSYMAGIKKVWKTHSIGIKECKQQFSPQEFDDKTLEFVGFKSELNLALERISRQSSKIAQGSGPFSITMKENKETGEDIFMQIDGESIKVRNLKTVRISASGISSTSQIRVMFRN